MIISMMTPMYFFIFFESIYKELLTLVTNSILKIPCVQYKISLLKPDFVWHAHALIHVSSA